MGMLVVLLEVVFVGFGLVIMMLVCGFYLVLGLGMVVLFGIG